MDKPTTNSARARLQELRAIPERLRTDAEWDELNELEIQLAVGIRPGAPGAGARGEPAAGASAHRSGRKRRGRLDRRSRKPGPR
jgi:hypothetical protein